ncbi:heterokaryon incompatibility protein-domain-containing protein, partial [Bombardia bombarda]
KEFMGHQIPPYAILSHTWGSNEVIYQDMLLRRDSDAHDVNSETKEGFLKVLGTCKLLKDHYAPLDWAWVDTCCIDKSSSAELSEAINSMYNWYRNSEICLVYLPDVSSGADLYGSFRQSRWFLRGWTLQELIAPRRVKFFSQDWVEIIDRYSWAEEIQIITGIP